jgi:DNA-binding NtrC family response regulator
MERRHILRVLERTQGKKAEAARLLGIHLKTLNRKLKQYRISP